MGKNIMICWECNEERECRPRMRPDHSVEYLCRDCLAAQAALDKLDEEHK